MKRVTYQIGVYVLGFPMYVEHYITRVITQSENKNLNRVKKYGQITDSKEVKQH